MPVQHWWRVPIAPSAQAATALVAAPAGEGRVLLDDTDRAKLHQPPGRVRRLEPRSLLRTLVLFPIPMHAAADPGVEGQTWARGRRGPAVDRFVRSAAIPVPCAGAGGVSVGA